MRHQGGRYGIDSLWNHAYTGYLIEGAGRRVFFAGDTGYDADKFRDGLGKVIDGVVECLNASAWARAK